MELLGSTIIPFTYITRKLEYVSGMLISSDLEALSSRMLFNSHVRISVAQSER